MTAPHLLAAQPQVGVCALGAGGSDASIAEQALSHVVPHDLIGGLTNQAIMMIAAGVLLLLFVPIAARKESLVPTGFRNFLEAILQFIREEVARPALGSLTDKYIPFIWTMFALILTANLLGLVPLGSIFEAITGNHHAAHWGGTATGNIGITAGLALCSFVLFHVSGARQQGVGKYFYNTFLGHAPWPLWPLFIPLEFIGALVKPFALAMRLFANMTGGHIVVAVLGIFAVQGIQWGIGESAAWFGVTLVSVLGAVAINLLELFVAFLQAYIFVFLTCLFLGTAVHPEH